jgi:hypothetical protein
VRISYKALGANGRLGNQLFQIASTLGRAHRAGDINNAVFPNWAYQPYFNVPDHYFVAANEITESIDGGRAYMQDLREFSSCVDIIQEFFQPTEFALTEARSLHPYFDFEIPHATAVHVRRGDYLGLQATVTVCPIHYFTQAMNEMREKFPDTHFLVFSDDNDWCLEHFALHDDVEVVMSPAKATPIQSVMADFNLMRSCDAFIISNSTYSWWAAYSSQSADVICPSRWLNGLASTQIPIETLLPKHWQRRSIDPIGPTRTPQLLVSQGDDGYIITDTRTRKIHHLNASATLLFELCTGSNTVEEIDETMSLIFPDDSWASGLQELLSLGLVQPAP